jgi:hypothetical protein
VRPSVKNARKRAAKVQALRDSLADLARTRALLNDTLRVVGSMPPASQRAIDQRMMGAWIAALAEGIPKTPRE